MNSQPRAQQRNDVPRDAPEELQRFLRAYRPSGVPEATWAQLAEPAVELVWGAGLRTRLRIEKDIQFLGALARHLVERGRPLTLDEALADTTLQSFDATLVASQKTRENKRGIFRRLQAAHCGVPWRTERRPDGERVRTLVSAAGVDGLCSLQARASDDAAENPDAACFTAAVEAARVQRRPGADRAAVDETSWQAARRYADARGVRLTKASLRAWVTHEVFDLPEPVAVLVSTYGLTRRDLDLALTRVAELPAVPSGEHYDALRGTRRPPAF